jgi:hypothetical protein
MPKQYLGDGAYAEWDGLGLTITAENGIEATDRVVLGPGELILLLVFLRGIRLDTAVDLLRTDIVQPSNDLLTLLLAHVPPAREER